MCEASDDRTHAPLVGAESTRGDRSLAADALRMRWGARGHGAELTCQTELGAGNRSPYCAQSLWKTIGS
jgi:hypothetical protein